MTKSVVVVLLSLIANMAMAQPAPKVTELMTKDIADSPGREMLMLLVEHPPGGVNPAHKHDAEAMVYVLEGSVVMQVKGGKEMTLTPGQTFYEGPKDIHTVDRNASATEPAKFVVFMIKQKGVPALMPLE